MTTKPKICPIILIFILIGLSTRAQLGVGLDAGVSYNNLFIPNPGAVEISKKLGHIVNINMSYNFNDQYALELSPNLVQKNYAVTNSKNIFQNINNTYIAIPISFKYTLMLSSKLATSFSAGGYYGYWIRSRVNGIAPNVFEISSSSDNEEAIDLQEVNYAYPFNSALDRRHELGWLGNLCLSFSATERVSYLIRFHYYQSITSQQKNTVLNDPKYNRTYALSTGLTYRFHK